ncbi:MAG: DUF1405 domain-containing protein [Halobacteriales archaeon]
MGFVEGVREMIDGSDDRLPSREPLPVYIAPLPAWLENLTLRLVWVIVAVNLLGTAFGFWYYGIHPFSTPTIDWQFAYEPLLMWPFVPDSPTATLFIALSFASWRLGQAREWLSALAFFGCIKLGLWTPYILVLFKDAFSYQHWAMYNFLVWSHLAMVLQAFVIHRYSDFPVRAVLVAVLWYGFNDLVDYFVPLVGKPHHTSIPAERLADGSISHAVPAHDYAAAGAIVLTLAATFLALSTRIKKLERGHDRG